MQYKLEDGSSGIDRCTSAGQFGSSGLAPHAAADRKIEMAQRRSPGNLAIRGVLASALLWSGGVLAHCDPAAGHFECPKPPEPTPASPVPGSSDRLLVNAISREVGVGPGGARVRAEVVNQVYSNNAQQRYLLVEATVRFPVAGIANRTQAQASRLALRYFRLDKADAYAECTLEPRRVTARSAVYAVGIKSNAAQTLLRWGHCDDLQSPGFDSILPLSTAGDLVKLVGPDGSVIAEFNAPAAVDVPMPAKPKRRPQPATARLLEGGTYRVKRR